MINGKRELTVEDMIIVYLSEKMKKGYEASFQEEELLDFLKFFKEKINLEVNIENYQNFMDDFIERKCREDWLVKPHINLDKDGTVSANYEFSAYDESVINPYFMTKKDSKKIIDVTDMYLKNMPKRSIEINEGYSADVKENAKEYSSLMILELWKDYVEHFRKRNRWPKQCSDIYNDLLEFDLAKVIKVPSIYEYTLEYYDTVTKRVATLLNKDEDLEISGYTNSFLANSNFNLVNEGFEKIEDIYIPKSKKAEALFLNHQLNSFNSKYIDYNKTMDDEENIKVAGEKDFDNKKLIKVLDSKIGE